MSRDRLIALQEALAAQVVIPASTEPAVQAGDWVCTMDIQYEGDIGYVAADLMRWEDEPDMIAVKAYSVTEPYVPGFFAFREGPLLMQLLQDIQAQLDLSPTLLIIDGHGIAHPRKLGLASWVGVKSGIASIGVAKDSLLPYTGKLGLDAGNHLSILLDTQAVGIALRTQDDIKPVFVSPGHLISLSQAANLVFQLRGPYRQIEPIRRADHAARRFAKGDILPIVRVLD
ncbi:MAG: endonuclease V [Bacteroidota bacterium]